MSKILLFLVLGFLLGGIIGFALGKSQPPPSQPVGLGSILKDAVAIGAAL
jgi:hypothetical protein